MSQVYEHQRNGGNFLLTKTMAGRGIRRFDIMPLDHFPTQDEVEELVLENYGGGAYAICPEGGPGRFKTYNALGPSKYRPQGQGTKPTSQGRKELKDAILTQAQSYLQELAERDPKLAERIYTAILDKELGVKLPSAPEPPKELSYEEELEREFLEQRPEYREALVLARLREKGVRPPKEPGPFDKLIEEMDAFLEVKEQIHRMYPPKSTLELLLEGLVPLVPKVIELLAILRREQPGLERTGQPQQLPGGPPQPASGQGSPSASPLTQVSPASPPQQLSGPRTGLYSVPTPQPEANRHLRVEPGPASRYIPRDC